MSTIQSKTWLYSSYELGRLGKRKSTVRVEVLARAGSLWFDSILLRVNYFETQRSLNLKFNCVRVGCLLSL